MTRRFKMLRPPGKLMRPPIPYYGGKYHLAKQLISLMPEHECYVEPFGGSAVVLINKPPVELEVYNDIDGEIVNFFRVLRDRSDELIRLLKLTPYSREEFALCLESTDDPLEQARRTFVKMRMGFSACRNLTPGNWKYNVKPSKGSAKNLLSFMNSIEWLPEIVERLKLVQIECRDALEVIQKFDSETTFFYLDPPYLEDTLQRSDLYLYHLPRERHIELAKLLKNIKGKFLLSGYSNPLYDELYKDCYSLTFNVVCIAGRKVGQPRTRRTEVVWANYELPSLAELQEAK